MSFYIFLVHFLLFFSVTTIKSLLKNFKEQYIFDRRLDSSVILKNVEYFILQLDNLYAYILVFLDIFSSRLLYCYKVLILLINYFSCIYGEEKTIRCSLVCKTTLRHVDHNPYHVIILENKDGSFNLKAITVKQRHYSLTKPSRLLTVRV